MKTAKQHLEEITGQKFDHFRPFNGDEYFSLDGTKIDRAEAKAARKAGEIIIIVNVSGPEYSPHPNSGAGEKMLHKYPK